MEASKRVTYKDRIITLVSRPQGVTADELLTMTHWQLHTLRGFFSHQRRGRVASRHTAGVMTYRMV